MATSLIQDPAGLTRPSVIFSTHENTSNTTNELKLENEGLQLEISEPEEDHTFQSKPTSITTYRPLAAKVKKLKQEIFQLEKDRLNDQSHFQEIISHLERKNAELDKRNRILTHRRNCISTQRDDEGTIKSAEMNEMSRKGLTDTEVVSLLETEDILQYIHRLSEMVHNHWPDNGTFVRQKTKLNKVLCRLRESLWQLKKVIKKQKQK